MSWGGADLWSEICDNMFKQYFFKFKQKLIDQNIKYRIETKKIKSKNKTKLAKYQIQNWNKKKTCLFVYNALRFFLSDKVCLFPASFAVALLFLCLRCQLFWLQFWHKFHLWVGFSGVPSYWLIWFDWQLSRTTTAPEVETPAPVICCCCWIISTSFLALKVWKTNKSK